MDKYQILKFIEECSPVFRKLNDGQFEMFTVPTQHIKSDSIEELIKLGIEVNEVNGGRSPLMTLFDNLSLIPDCPVSNTTHFNLDGINETMKMYFNGLIK